MLPLSGVTLLKQGDHYGTQILIILSNFPACLHPSEASVVTLVGPLGVDHPRH